MKIREVLRTSTLGVATLAGAGALAQTGYFGPLMHFNSGTFPEDCCGIHAVHMKGGNFLLWGRATRR